MSVFDRHQVPGHPVPVPSRVTRFDRLTSIHETLSVLHKTDRLHARDVQVLTLASIIDRTVQQWKLIDFPYDHIPYRHYYGPGLQDYAERTPPSKPRVIASHQLGWLVTHVMKPVSTSASKESASLLLLDDGRAATSQDYFSRWAENDAGQYVIPEERLSPLEDTPGGIDLRKLHTVLSSFLLDAQK